jgi:hypothetical protein
MQSISGTISAKDVEISFIHNDVELKSNGTISMIRDIHFAAFERVSPKLKTCEIVLVNSDNRPVIITIFQKLLPQITPLLKCSLIFIGQDPENWTKLGNVARKNDWQKKDWLHVFSEEETEKDEEEWLPGDDESSDSDSEDSDDEFILEKNMQSE